MNFFESQSRVRRNTAWLVFLFSLAVVSLVIMTNLLVMLASRGVSLDSVLEELKPIQQRVREYLNDLSNVDSIINEGCEAARDVAQDTMEEVRKVMGLTGRR